MIGKPVVSVKARVPQAGIQPGLFAE